MFNAYRFVEQEMADSGQVFNEDQKSYIHKMAEKISQLYTARDMEELEYFAHPSRIVDTASRIIVMCADLAYTDRIEETFKRGYNYNP
jgi:hypothetical protein